MYFLQVTFDYLEDEDDTLWSSVDRETKQEMARRAYQFMKWLGNREQNEIVVATHSSFLFTLFHKVLVTDDEELLKWFNTGEIRSVVVEFPQDSS